MDVSLPTDTDRSLVNRVAESAVVTVDLAAVVGPLDVARLDLAPLMHRGLVVRERDFRASVAAIDDAAFAGRHVAVVVPEGALVPAWAPMLVASRLSGVAASVAVGSVEARRAALASEAVRAHDWSFCAGRPVVLKGCGTGEIPLDAFAQAALALQGVASKVMFGEACSAVPVWRRPSVAAPAPPPAAGVPLPAGRPARATLPARPVSPRAEPS